MSIPRILILTLLVVTGCSRGYSVRPNPSGVRVDQERKAAIQAELRRCASGIETIKGISQSKINGQSGVRQVFVARYPNRFRFETFPRSSAYGLNLLLLRDGILTYIDRVEKKALEEKDGVGAMVQAFRLPFRAADLSFMLTGCLSEDLLQRRGNDFYRGDALSLVTQDESIFAQFGKRGEGYKLDFAEFRDPLRGSYIAKMSFPRYRSLQGELVPEEIIFESPRYELEGSFSLAQMKLNEPVSDRVFNVSVPSHYSVMKSR